MPNDKRKREARRMKKKIIPATIIVHGKEYPIIHAIIRKQMERVLYE